MASDLERMIVNARENAPAAPVMIGLNDTQAVMFLAGLVSGDGISEQEAVAYAITLVVETKVQLESGALARALDAARARVSANR